MCNVSATHLARPLDERCITQACARAYVGPVPRGNRSMLTLVFARHNGMIEMVTLMLARHSGVIGVRTLMLTLCRGMI